MKSSLFFLIILAGMIAIAIPSVMATGANAPTPAPASEEALETPVYHSLTAEEAKGRIDSDDTLIILDVRTQEEYDAGHIPDAIVLPNETIGDAQPELLPDLNAEILVYCRSGNRSAQAAKKLIAIGYTNVVDFGGIIDWPYEVVTE